MSSSIRRGRHGYFHGNALAITDGWYLWQSPVTMRWRIRCVPGGQFASNASAIKFVRERANEWNDAYFHDALQLHDGDVKP